MSEKLEDGKLTGHLSLTLLRPLLVQPMVVQVQPGEELGLDVDVARTNGIQNIDNGLIADLNKVYPLVERFDIEPYSDFQPNEQTSEGSFSSVSTPNFA